MRTMMKVQIPLQAWEDAARSGSLQGVAERVGNIPNFEAAYFFVDEGMGTAVIFFDIEASQDVVLWAKPIFPNADARVTFTPVMNTDDLIQANPPG